MSTAQQLGLIGNSIKVQSLPTASAETFGAGNRFYTLIGQQEGYITGHTYHTVVANDVYSWEDVGNALMLLALVDGTITANSSIEVALSNFSRRPLIDDTLIVYSNASQYALMKVSAVTSTAATLIVKDNSAANIVSTKGEAGLMCLTLATTKFYIATQYSIPFSAFNRTPKVGETFIRYSTKGEYALLQVDSITSTAAVCTVPGSSVYIVSTGRDVLQLKDAYNFSTHVGDTLNFAESNFNRTPVVNETFVFFDAQNQYGTAQVKSSQTISGEVHWFSTVLTVVSTKGETGATGAAGVGITNATAGTPTVADGKTTTPITFSLSDGSTKQVNVEAQNGADGQSNYNLLSNIPVQNQDLSASGFTPVANTYYRHTGTTGTYTQGVIYCYDGTEYKALDGAGGISDVKVNGTSVVTDSVANIPPASRTVNGVVTTGEQTFAGKKTFNPVTGFDGGVSILASGSKTIVRPKDVSYAVDFGTSSNRISHNYSDYVDASQYIKTMAMRDSSNNNLDFPGFAGSFMVTPSTWSSGTSGSLTLTENGTYQFYYGDNLRTNFGLLYVTLGAETIAYGGQNYQIEMDTNNVIHVYSINPQHDKAEVTVTLKYRRLGL